MKAAFILAAAGFAAAHQGHEHEEPAAVEPPAYGQPPKEAPPQTPTCPEAGDRAADGRYSCNPAHSYPDDAICQKVEDGCYYLRTPAPGFTASFSIPPAPTQTPACPAAGEDGAAGKHSCNPAHSYPEGRVCEKDAQGCYYLNNPSPPTSAPPAPGASAPACAEIGTSSPDGRYSCNPAHSYGSVQTCTKDEHGCFYLTPGTSSSVPVPQQTAPSYSPPKPDSPAAASPPSYQPVSPAGVSPPSYQPVSPPSHHPDSPVGVSPPSYQPSKGGNVTRPGTNTTTPITPYTGGAAMLLVSGAPIVAAVLAAFFL